MITRKAQRIREFLSLPAGNRELIKAQYRAFSKQIPLMYFILVSNTWATALTFLGSAPSVLTISTPFVLSVFCATRVMLWWKSRIEEPTLDTMVSRLERINYMAFVIASMFTGWSLLLFPYGDAYTRSHLAFYMAITFVSCVLSLLHLRSATLIVLIIINGGFIGLLVVTGHPTFVASAVNMAIVSIGLLIIININYHTLSRMADAQAEARRREEAQSRLLRMIDDMPVAVMTVDPVSLEINYANETSKELIRQIEHLLPIDSVNLVGTPIDVFHRNPHYQRSLLADPKNLPHHARINLGTEILDLGITAIMSDEGAYLGPMLTWAIVTKEVAAEQRILQLAHYDTLTGLANRTTFNERLQANLQTNLQAPGNGPGILFIDLDGFKLVNDTRGHRVGDDLLQQVARRLKTVCSDPAMTIGRLGGDEFAVIIPEDSISILEQWANRIIDAISAPYGIEHNSHVQVGASIGIATAPDHGSVSELLLARADIALYAAKAAGKGTYRVFSEEMEYKIHDHEHLQRRLRAALKANEGLFVFYQPIINARTKEVTAREALVRWHLPEKGWIPPSEFIPVAEQSDLIDLLGEFVLNTACQDAAGWNDEARVAVNISAVQLGKGTLTAAVLEALTRSELSPDRLEIEVTETAMINDEQGGMGDLRAIRRMGVRVVLDDFGTGYSSLMHLRTFPFDKIKIDETFVKNAIDGPESAAVVRVIADLGKRLGVPTVAEGVETEAHLLRAVEEGCSEIQGYLWGRPAPSRRDAAAVADLDRQNTKSGQLVSRLSGGSP